MDIEQYAAHTPHLPARGESVSVCIQEALRAAPHGIFLDVGAGGGANLAALSSAGLLAGFDEVHAVDLSVARVEALKALLPSVRAQVADACRLPFADRSVDFYYSDQVIEHVPDDRSMALELRRVLSDTGRAVVGSVLKGPGAWYFHRCNGQWTLDATHVREYRSEGAYGELFRSANLKVNRIEIEPIRFSVADLALTALMRSKVLDPSQVSRIYANDASIPAIRRLRITVPRYYRILAFISK